MPEANFLVRQGYTESTPEVSGPSPETFQYSGNRHYGKQRENDCKRVSLSIIAQRVQHRPLPPELQLAIGGSAVGMADERQEYIRHLRSRHFPAGRNGTPSTYHRTNHRRNHKHRGSASGELYLFHAEMSRKADVVQRLRSNHL